MKITTDILSFLNSFKDRDIQLYLDQDKLKIKSQKGSLQKEDIEKIKINKEDIIQFLSGFKLPTEESISNWISKIKIPERIPLSFSQQRLWFIEQLYAGKNIYNESVALKIDGNITDLDIKKGVHTLVDRQSVLKTSFPLDSKGNPYQKIHTQFLLPIQYEDISVQKMKAEEGMLNEGQRMYVQKISNTMNNIPFNMERGPLIRINILKFNDSEHVLIVTMHHIIADGWALGIFLNEFIEIVFCQKNNQTLNLEKLPIQYTDFTLWQQDTLKGNRLQKLLDYWKEKLKNVDSSGLKLPIQKSNLSERSFNGAVENFYFSTELSKKITQLSVVTGNTFFITTMSIFNVLLKLLTSKNDISIGVPIANRNHSDLENLIGFFANTIVMRNKIFDKESFIDFLKRVKENSLEAFEHQDLPFELLVKELNIDRNLNNPAIFNIMFNVGGVPALSIKRNNLKYTPIGLKSQKIKFDLSFIIERENELIGRCEYDTGLFNKQGIQTLISCFKTVLEQITENPKIKLEDISLISKSEESKIEKWEKGITKNLPSETVLEAFYKIVDKTPDTIAFIEQTTIQEEATITFKELDKISTKWAQHLLYIHYKEEDAIGICMESSIDAIILMLAVLKIGAVYFPLDPKLPSEKIQQMAISANSTLVFTTTETDKLFENTEIIRIQIKNSKEPPSNQTTANFPNINGDNIAYCIFTSGSTGTPNGVLVKHNSLMNLCYWHQKTFQINEKSKTSQVANLAFDASVWEIWSSITSGATCYLIEKKTLINSQELSEKIIEKEIEVCFLPTIIGEQLLQLNTEKYSKLRYLLIGGDKLKCPRNKNKTNFKIINNYGPTEATVVATSCEINTATELRPIGKPIFNTSVYILGENMQRLPIGCIGELYIGGKGVAKSYLNNPKFTSKKFVTNPFNTKNYLYKTGDTGYYDLNGNIQFTGRIDNQIQFYGIRLELGELEQIAMTHPKILDSVFFVCDQKIISFLMIDKNTKLSTKEFRSFIATKVLNRFIPSHIFIKDNFPLTHNGKADRKKLESEYISSIKERPRFPKKQHQKDLTNIETQLLDIYSTVLRKSNLTVHNNFFHYGGHSLLVPKIANEIKKKLNISLSLSYFFEFPTVANLAREISHSKIPEKEIVWEEEWELDEDTRPIKEKNDVPWSLKTSLISGVTGFVGAHLLGEILEKTSTNVFCLVRSKNDVSFQERIELAMIKLNIWKESYKIRIIPIEADLEKPYLGISKSDYERLCREVDIIYHNGAHVNSLYNYHTLKPANVNGTKEIIKLAIQYKNKSIRFISTTSVFPAFCEEANESADISEFPKSLTNGYAQSKCVAEKMILEAGKRGVDTAIFRLSRVVGNRNNGATNTEDLISKVLNGIVTLGHYFQIPSDVTENLIPVDYVVEKIFSIGTQEHNNAVYHIANSKEFLWKDIIDVLIETHPNLIKVDHKEWNNVLEKNAENDEDKEAIHPLLLLNNKEGKKIKQPSISVKNLKNTNSKIPQVNKNLIKKMINYLLDIKFIKN